MVRSPYVTAALILGAIALLTNPLWFFPAEGEPRHTYTRVPVETGNGSLVYEPPDDGSDGRLNDLVGAGLLVLAAVRITRFRQESRVTTR